MSKDSASASKADEYQKNAFSDPLDPFNAHKQYEEEMKKTQASYGASDSEALFCKWPLSWVNNGMDARDLERLRPDNW